MSSLERIYMNSVELSEEIIEHPFEGHYVMWTLYRR